MTTIYRADTIGSLLRPAYLKEARKAWGAKKLSTAEFKRVEDRAVDEAIALQEAAGLEIVTDGEMRRLVFTGTLTEAIAGLSPAPTPSWRWHGQTPEQDMDVQMPVCVAGKIRRLRSLATEEFQCGFASVIQGNPITVAAQEAKLRLVVDVARRVWA
jgi:5-methyltetrahydropteroyltriglutamate--homocysteine methyltransferase